MNAQTVIASTYSETAGHTFRVGSLAFFDSFAGLVPVKVQRVPKGGPFAGWLINQQTHSTGNEITAQVTATRGPYKRGQIVTAFADKIVPRSQVITRGGQYRIRTNYSWE